MSNTLLIETGQNSAKLLLANHTFHDPSGVSTLGDFRSSSATGNFNLTTNAQDLIDVARELLEASRATPEQLELVLIFASGLDHPSSQPKVVEAFREAGLRQGCMVHANNDGKVGLAALSIHQQHCGSITVGTGQNSHFLGNGLYRQKGGSGYLLSDGEFGGVAIGKMLIDKCLYEMGCLLADNKGYESEWKLVSEKGGPLLKRVFQIVSKDAKIPLDELKFSADLFFNTYSQESNQTANHTRFFSQFSSLVGEFAEFQGTPTNQALRNDVTWAREAFKLTARKLVEYISAPMFETGFYGNKGVLSLTGSIAEKNSAFRAALIPSITEKFKQTTFHEFPDHESMLKEALFGSIKMLADGGPIFDS